jgi:carbamoyl-phosphate synthase large subunit
VPRRDDIEKILLVGSGPIVIGQAAEFDYSGVQACKVLLADGYEVVLVNSNPATIMTDPEFATATYVEPLLPGPLAKIIEKERPDALLPTLGGQTALNLARDLHEDGTLDRFGVELIGANYESICRAEDRELFRRTMEGAGLRIPWSITVESLAEAEAALADGRVRLPAIVRPAFTLGGEGGGVGESETELRQVVSEGLAASPINQVLVEESVLGWGEFELEVMRDRNDNVVIICSIENVDPMGVHTGDSVTVAPAQTLTDTLYQDLRDRAILVIRAVGVETGGSNIQFALDPESGEIVVIEMNPRVSRSSALASKATGFPIAKMAAKLAVGYALEEIPNDITRATPASFEPTIDYVVTKVPRFAFEKFPGAEGRLSTHMKSVGEAMAIGRTFRESFAKAMRSRELDSAPAFPATDEELLARLETPSPDRFDLVLEAFRRGSSVEELHRRSLVDRWFLRELEALALEGDGTDGLTRTFKSVDTCAAEFEAATPYYYSAHERPGPSGKPASEIRRGSRDSIVILGAGPNRIGQGIEFDYCCVHAAMTVRESGRDAVMINCNPETVSTDYDTSDRLYFEPLTAEDVLAVVEREQPQGVIVQFGGQTPLKLARPLEEAGVPLLGTPVEAIDLAEDRGRFGALLRRLGIKHPPYGTALSADEAVVIADQVGFPLLVRPSYVLGGRAMEICYSAEGLAAYLEANVKASQDHPLLLDRFLENAIEVDVDALGDGEEVAVAGIMQHVEEAGVHSGDSACVIPPMSLGEQMLEEIRAATRRIALELGVVGLINIQYGVAGGQLHVLEANPRASRTVPFVSKAIGAPLAKIACRLMLGERLSEQDLPEAAGDHVSVKEAVLPFSRFAGADSVLGPEMKSTGEVMGIAADFPTAFGKAQAAAGVSLPHEGTVFITVTDTDKPAATQIAARFCDLGFRIVATAGTAQSVSAMGVPVTPINKIAEGSPHVVDWIRDGSVDLVINTPTGSGARTDGYEIRTAAVRRGIPCITTMTGASAAVRAIAAQREREAEVRSVQELHGQVRARH